MTNAMWVALGALIIIALVFGFQRLEISHLDSRIESLVTENATLTAANQSFALSAKQQNAAITALQTQAVAREKSATLAIAQAEKQSQQYELKARRIASEATTGDECQDVRAIVTDYFAGAKQ